MRSSVLLLILLLAGPTWACDHRDTLANYEVPDRYKSLHPIFIDTLRKSYLRHNKDNKFLDNAFWGTSPDDKCTWPKTLWEGLDNVGPKGVYTLANIWQKTDRAFVSSTVSRVRNIWFGTSFGFTFEGTDPELKDMVEYIKSRGTFCKDLESVSKKEHHGQTCWRQIPTDSKGMGLHFCFGAGRPTEVHVDFNQVALRRVPWSDLCVYDPIALYKHYKDIKGSAPRTIFDALEDERADLERLKRLSETACKGFEKYLVQLNLDQMLEKVSKHRVQKVASLGEGAPSAGQKVISSILKDKEKLYSFAFCICK